MLFQQQGSETGRSTPTTIPHFLNQFAFLSIKFMLPTPFLKDIFVIGFSYICQTQIESSDF